jgi:hypothetical protein
VAREGDNLHLTWTPVPDADFYTVWVGSIAPATPQNSTIIATTSATSYIDTNVPAVGTEFYFITANQ